MTAGAQGIKNVTLELGGKSPLIIFEDANLKNAVKGALMANFFTQGEVCSNGTRVFVQRGIYEEFIKEFVFQAKNMKIGDPLLDDTTVGATISEEHALKVLSYIRSAVSEGAKLEYGGERVLLEGDCKDGWFLSPAVLTNCRDDMKAVKEEIFGSVASVLVFDTEKEVVERANDTVFGLAGGVFTNNLTRAHRVISQIQAGTTWINTFNLSPAEVPFGGWKMSGIGRENGWAGIDHYTQYKTTYVEMNDVDCGQLYTEH
ncbi:4-trimethylaminobutyraldehyde dehydrogenase [Eurytemora carolleeae]|uniref:4-trimethylaminobutyraldehyde dehydrogenase n=1 Tax=Eurytemora carolleeae TaxID=1294199 RepID=UPI000C779ACA|nr:4-trimethylaminobutyraldehyde dehydrogenase [Eurytemora carolleeae]|eukprot:XP_023323142.1 4-trimethylaminobutyraldehyde dehydrogenase-like [Eurytemora affinis]